MPIVVSDTSTIRALAHLGRLDLLSTSFERVWNPPAVRRKLIHPTGDYESIAVDDVRSVFVRAPLDRARVTELNSRLQLGKSEALAWAVDLNIRDILMDEARGRAVAAELGLNPVGVLALLVRAKKLGEVESVKPLIDRLQNEYRFFISAVVRELVLRLAGERDPE